MIDDKQYKFLPHNSGMSILTLIYIFDLMTILRLTFYQNNFFNPPENYNNSKFVFIKYLDSKYIRLKENFKNVESYWKPF